MVELFLAGAATQTAAQVQSASGSRLGRAALRAVGAVGLDAAPIVARAGRKAR
jgi:hypothetical protein